HCGRGEVADLALELQVRAAAARGGQRDPDLDEDLVGLQAGLERPGEERPDGDPPFALRADRDDFGADRQPRRRMVVGRIAVGQVAADGGKVAYHRVGDDLRGVVEQGIARPYQLGLFQLRFARERADPENAVSLTDTRQTGDSVDVDDVRRARE